MELLLLGVAALVALTALLVHRRIQVVAWDRELRSAFGESERREISRRRVL
ncbi:hypothetical protein [Nocardioides pakistanensis]